ncbi:MAG: GIY-YIG nuclease family protein [Vicinamibacterales bacterium]
MPWVYILRCGDNSLYVGHTSDLDSRLESHRKGLAANHTSLRLPIELVYSEQFGSLVNARRREHQLKRWSAQKKMALAAGDLHGLHSLARRRHSKKQR